VEAWGGTTTEAKGRRELAQQGILPSLAGGERYGRYSTVMDCHYHLPKVKAAQLQDSGNSSCCCCWYITDCVQPTAILAISHGWPGHYSSRPMPSPCMGTAAKKKQGRKRTAERNYEHMFVFSANMFVHQFNCALHRKLIGYRSQSSNPREKWIIGICKRV
jgi:hypothetical protein